MASYQKQREDFIAAMAREGMPTEVARQVLRYANTLQRLAVAECNGPGDYVNRIPYPRAGEIIAKFEADTEKAQERATSHLHKLLQLCPGFTASIGGDPRGNVVKLQLPSGKWNGWERADGWCVPTRCY